MGKAPGGRWSAVKGVAFVKGRILLVEMAPFGPESARICLESAKTSLASTRMWGASARTCGGSAEIRDASARTGDESAQVRGASVRMRAGSGWIWDASAQRRMIPAWARMRRGTTDGHPMRGMAARRCRKARGAVGRMARRKVANHARMEAAARAFAPVGVAPIWAGFFRDRHGGIHAQDGGVVTGAVGGNVPSDIGGKTPVHGMIFFLGARGGRCLNVRVAEGLADPG